MNFLNNTHSAKDVNMVALKKFSIAFYIKEVTSDPLLPKIAYLTTIHLQNCQ